jgi:hypothetical protein
MSGVNARDISIPLLPITKDLVITVSQELVVLS